MSIEFEDESQSIVERCKLLVCHASNEFAESFGRDGRRLLDQDLSLLISSARARSERSSVRKLSTDIRHLYDIK